MYKVTIYKHLIIFVTTYINWYSIPQKEKKKTIMSMVRKQVKLTSFVFWATWVNNKIKQFHSAKAG